MDWSGFDDQLLTTGLCHPGRGLGVHAAMGDLFFLGTGLGCVTPLGTP
jgi:hypothetical protein